MSKWICAAAIACFVLVGHLPHARAEPVSTFRITFATQAFGAMDAVVHFETTNGELVGRSSSSGIHQLGNLLREPSRGQAVLLLRLRESPKGGYEGTIDAPRSQSRIQLTFGGDQLTGAVAEGVLAGPVAGTSWSSNQPLRNYPAIIAKMDAVLPSAIFDPNQLQRPEYRRFQTMLGKVADATHDDADLLFAFSLGWDKKIFSHFALQRQARADIVAGVDTGTRPAVELDRQGAIAILRVHTFLGERASDQLKAAFARLKSEPPAALIIDLRGTPGDSLSVREVLNAVLVQPAPLGWFVANAWWRSNSTLPTAAQLALQPLDMFDNPQDSGQRLNSTGIVKVGLAGSSNAYAGKLFVLIDRHTESVAELAAAALKGLGRATLVGERSAGELLSADTIPLQDGFSLYLPLYDYFDARAGRIEGRGVTPDVATPSADALDRAMALLH